MQRLRGQRCGRPVRAKPGTMCSRLQLKETYYRGERDLYMQYRDLGSVIPVSHPLKIRGRRWEG
jgi:hypothetical protein